jgi:hypothetical protein
LAYKLEAEHFPTKPYDPQVLLRIIKKAPDPNAQLEKFEKGEKERSSSMALNNCSFFNLKREGNEEDASRAENAI